MNSKAQVFIEQISNQKGYYTEKVQIPTDTALWMIVKLSDGREFKVMPNDDNTGIDIFGDSPILIKADASNHLTLTLKERWK